MTALRKAILASFLAFGFLAALPPLLHAQSPIPAEPDTERRTRYSISGSQGPLAVGFDLYGDGTDYANWIEVYLNGVKLAQAGNWTMSSVSGSFTTLARPITNATITFVAAQTGTVDIVGARRPRRVSQFQESQPIPARSHNQVLTDLWMTLRERWDRFPRMLTVPPGETLALLPPVSSRANSNVCFDSGGNIAPCLTPLPGTSFSAGSGIVFTGTNPTTISTNPVSNPIANSGLAQMPGTTVKCNNTGGPSVPFDCTVAQAQTLLQIRPRLTNNLTIIQDNVSGVDQPGCGGGTGASACRSVQYAVNRVCNDFDNAGFKVTIQLTVGQNNIEQVNLCNYINGMNDTGNAPEIRGDPTNSTTVQNYVINGSGGNAVTAVAAFSPWVLNGITLVSVGGKDLLADINSFIYVKNVGFSTAVNQMQALYHGKIEWVGPIYILTPAANFASASVGGQIVARPVTVTIFSSPNFSSAFLAADRTGVISIAGVTWAGTAATGNQCSITYAGGVSTNGALASIPGTPATCSAIAPGWAQ